MSRFNLRALALAALVFVGFAAPAAADICVRGPFAAGQPATTFEPVYGPRRGDECDGRVAAAKAAGARAPTVKQYQDAIDAVQKWCGEKCQPNHTLMEWARTSGGRAAPAPRQPPQAAVPQEQRPVRPAVQRTYAPAPAYAAPAPVRQHGGVTVICAKCYIQ